MMTSRMIWCLSILFIFLVGCQSNSDESKIEVPVTYENLTVEELGKKTTLPVKLPTVLPFEPKEVFITLDDYQDLYEKGEQVEEIQVRYIKTHREGRYLDVSISNFEQISEEGETVLLENGTEAVYAEDEIGQLLFWKEGNLNYRLVYYTSTKVNEGQKPLSLEQLIEIANSFEPIEKQ